MLDNRIGVNHSYKELQFEHIPKHPFHVGSQTKYMDIIRAVNEKMAEHLRRGVKIEMPSGLGDLQVVKFKPKRPGINFKATKEAGRTIRYNNLHTNGFAQRIHWYKRKAKFRNKSLMGFKLTKDNRRANAQYVFQNGIYHLLEYVK